MVTEAVMVAAEVAAATVVETAKEDTGKLTIFWLHFSALRYPVNFGNDSSSDVT